MSVDQLRTELLRAGVPLPGGREEKSFYVAMYERCVLASAPAAPPVAVDGSREAAVRDESEVTCRLTHARAAAGLLYTCALPLIMARPPALVVSVLAWCGW